MIGGDGREYVFEKKSNARLAPSDFGADVTLVQDDEVFRDAVVQMGTAGVVTEVRDRSSPH